ncbi:recombinase RecB [Allosaccharopolyspora coralli]|uniref:Recombinase RecB n=1 Tax=Allosaccharopolyspora coralli TaxID=2665642 RepID=A0A5Q3Q3H3_9PSEU|nr:PD-(D/E)XK nuclease family protein [Allosaccharopolyspora coralli]QGK68893.1 recombinase RecB [Allosaccharopolyspora coralli]
MQGQLGLEGIPAELVRITPARLNTWAACPRRYRMAYVDRPTPPRAGPHVEATVGAAVHNALKAVSELPATQRTSEKAVSELRRCWKHDGFRDRTQSVRHRDRAAGWLSEYVAGRDGDLSPLAVERWVSAPAGSIIAEGRVDRVDQRGEEIVVVDYKTGRHVPETDDARTSRALALYAIAARRTFRKPCRRVELHHVPSSTVASWEHTEDSLAEHLADAGQTAGRIGRATEAHAAGEDRDVWFPPRTGGHCSRCDFPAHCPEGTQAAPDLAPWAKVERDDAT